jgi:hypothetical protein
MCEDSLMRLTYVAAFAISLFTVAERTGNSVGVGDNTDLSTLMQENLLIHYSVKHMNMSTQKRSLDLYQSKCLIILLLEHVMQKERIGSSINLKNSTQDSQATH